MFYKLKLWLKVCKKVVKVLIAEVLVFWIVVIRERMLCVHFMWSGVYCRRAVQSSVMACLVVIIFSNATCFDQADRQLFVCTKTYNST
jgi:hypothetical protein